jgi:hypothetical protein
MQGRSWMAALTVASAMIAVLEIVPSARADEPKTTTKIAAKPEKKAESKKAKATPSAPTYVVRLDLKIAGLSGKGCDVEIKPGNAGCKFKAVTQHIDSDGTASVKFKDVETESADRDCTFAITVREPGQAEKTVKRGLRLKAPSPDSPAQSLDCFLSSPSKIARAEQERALKR